MTIPFGRWRLVIPLSLSPSPSTSMTLAQAKAIDARRSARKFPEATDATDRELEKLALRATMEAERRQRQVLAITHGFRG